MLTIEAVAPTEQVKIAPRRTRRKAPAGLFVRTPYRKNQELSAPSRSSMARICSGMPRTRPATITPAMIRQTSRPWSAPRTDVAQALARMVTEQIGPRGKNTWRSGTSDAETGVKATRNHQWILRVPVVYTDRPYETIVDGDVAKPMPAGEKPR